MIILLSIILLDAHACKNRDETISDDISEFSEYILSVEVTNRQTRNMTFDNAAGRIDFDMERSETKTGVNIELTLADGVSMISPATAQADYNLTYPAEVKLSAGGRTVIFTIRAGVYNLMITEFILAAEVTNKQTRNMLIKNDAKEISFDLANTESKSDVNIELTLADGVSMASPATEQADYDLTKPAQIELLAEDRKVVFTIKSRDFDPLYSSENQLVIGIWVPPQPHLITTAANIRMRYKQIAEAGINLVWGNQWTYMYDSPGVLNTILDACAEFGIGFLPYLGVTKRGQINETDELARHIARTNMYKDHPAVVGFALCDEPPTSAFDWIATVSRAVDPLLPEGKYTVTNLYPTYGLADTGSPDYETHVDDFMRIVQPKILSFDHYPLTNSNDQGYRDFRDRWMVENLITIRNSSINYDVPFWGFVQAIGWNTTREPTYNEYRWLCNAHIVFGAKGISYFLYAMPYSNGGGEGFTNAMLDWNGNLTYLYDYAKNINAELYGFANKVMPFQQDGFILANQNAQMTATIPANLRKTSYGNLSKIETSGEMLNGCFDMNGQKAVYLFNWSKDNPLTARLVFNGIVSFQLWGKDGLETEQTASEWDVSFLPGEAKFLIFI